MERGGLTAYTQGTLHKLTLTLNVLFRLVIQRQTFRRFRCTALTFQQLRVVSKGFLFMCAENLSNLNCV